MHVSLAAYAASSLSRVTATSDITQAKAALVNYNQHLHNVVQHLSAEMLRGRCLSVLVPSTAIHTARTRGVAQGSTVELARQANGAVGEL